MTSAEDVAAALRERDAAYAAAGVLSVRAREAVRAARADGVGWGELVLVSGLSRQRLWQLVNAGPKGER